MMVVRICGRRQNFYVFGVYRSPNTDDRVYDCLLSSMARIQTEDSKAVFCFVGDFNCHNAEWLGSRRTDNHGRAAQEFSVLADCAQLVRGPTHLAGGTLDLVMTNVPDLCKVRVGDLLGPDHSFISIHISTSLPVEHFCVPRLVHQKSRVRWDVVEEDVRRIPWSTIIRSPDAVQHLNTALSDIIARRVPSVRIRVRNFDTPWFNDECRALYDRKQTAYRKWNRTRNRDDHEAFLLAQREANACYSRAQREHRARCRTKLAETPSAHAWWKALKEAVFGTSSSIPPLVDRTGKLLSHPRDKAQLLSEHFDSKQSREDICLPQSCHREPLLNTLAFRARDVSVIIRSLDSRGGTDPLGVFPLFLKQVEPVIAPKLSAIFRNLIRSGSFPDSWRCANVVPVPKGCTSSSASDYRPISITPIVSKVFEKLLAPKLSSFLNGVLPPRQYAYRKGMGTCDALLDITQTCQAALDIGQEARIVQLDFSAAFDRVNHAGLIYKLESVGVGGSFLSIIREFLTSRSQCVVVDGCMSSSVRVVSGVPQGSVIGPLLFLLYTADLADVVENIFITYADDSTLIAIIPTPADRARVSASLDRDLDRISAWCKMWGMTLNASKTYSLIVSRSRTVEPPHPTLQLHQHDISVAASLTILGVRLDERLTFECHVRDVASRASQKLGILRQAWRLYQDVSIVSKCFWSYILPILEYCSPVWSSAADTHLRLLDRVVRTVFTLSNGQVLCDLDHRRSVAELCVFHKLFFNFDHPVKRLMPGPMLRRRDTRRTLAAHEFAVQPIACRTEQFRRCFFTRVSTLWNSLDGAVFGGPTLSSFKSRTNRLLLGRRT